MKYKEEVFMIWMISLFNIAAYFKLLYIYTVSKFIQFSAHIENNK